MSDANAGTNENISDDLISAVAEANHEVYASRGQLDKAEADPAATGKTGGGTPNKEKAKESTEPEGDNAERLDTQDFSREPVPSTTGTEEATQQAAVEEPSKTEPIINEDWKQNLPAPVEEFKLEIPKPDEEGRIDPDEYSDYMDARADYRAAVREYNNKVVEVTTNTVEQILPEVKTTPAFRTAIESVFTQTGDGEAAVKLAQEFRSSLDKLAGEKKAEGIQSSKVSIEVQKNATVEAKGASQKKNDTTKSDNISRRIARNDSSVFDEIMDDWLDAGKV